MAKEERLPPRAPRKKVSVLQVQPLPQVVSRHGRGGANPAKPSSLEPLRAGTKGGSPYVPGSMYLDCSRTAISVGMMVSRSCQGLPKVLLLLGGALVRQLEPFYASERRYFHYTGGMYGTIVDQPVDCSLETILPIMPRAVPQNNALEIMLLIALKRRNFGLRS